jgi:predicted DNA-binding transcriptional regulator YafY
MPPLRDSSRRQSLHSLLNNGSQPTIDELRRQLEITSDRHIRRLIAELRTRGINVMERREGRHKRFYLHTRDRQAEVPVLGLTERELLALTVAAEAARAVLDATPLGEPLRSAAARLHEHAGRQVLSFEPELAENQWHFGTSAPGPVDPAIFDTVTCAVRDCEALRIDYHAASSGRHSKDRLVDPYVVAVRSGSWLMAAFCHESGLVRDFALGGISRAEPTDTYFLRPADFDAALHYRDRFGAVGGAEVEEVRLLVSTDKAAYFRRKMYHPTQQIEEDTADGLVVSYEVAGLEEIAAFVRSWGPDVAVLAPSALAERIRCDAEQTLAACARAARHKESPTGR